MNYKIFIDLSGTWLINCIRNKFKDFLDSSLDTYNIHKFYSLLISFNYVGIEIFKIIKIYMVHQINNLKSYLNLLIYFIKFI